MQIRLVLSEIMNHVLSFKFKLAISPRALADAAYYTATLVMLQNLQEVPTSKSSSW